MNISRKTTFALLFLGAAAVRLVFHYLTGFTADDALITFRYAENLAAGNGFVYNLGEKVLGTTTPLFTFLLALFVLLKVPAFTAALFVSLACSGVTAVIIYRLAQMLRFTSLSFVPALIYILWPRSIVADSSGLETSFFTLLVASAWYFQHRRLWYYSIALATLASVTRPEGFFLLGLVLVYNCWKDSRNTLAYLTVPATIIIPWLAFSYWYFGTIIPSSITGKLALYSYLAIDSPWQNLVYLLGLHSWWGWLMLAAAVMGGWWLYQKQNFGRLELIWLAVMVAFFSFGRTQLFFWYVVPIYPLFIIFVSAAIPFQWDRIAAWSKGITWVRLALAVLIAGGLIYMCHSQYVYYKNYARYLNEVHQEIGLYLKANSRPGDVVSAKYIGYTGYYSELRVQDRDGMVNPLAAGYNRRGDYLGLVMDFRPEWVVAAPNRETEEFAKSPVFLAQYELAKSYGWEERVAHNLYRRKDQP